MRTVAAVVLLVAGVLRAAAAEDPGQYDCPAVSFSPDGQWIATASADQTSKVWEAANSKELLLLSHQFRTASNDAQRLQNRLASVKADDSLAKLVEETGIKLDAPWGEASLSAFRMDVSNEQTFNPITLATTSGGASRRRGLELQGAVHPHPWLGLSADWTLNDAKYLDFITESGDTLGGRPIFNTARYVGSASIDLAPPRGSWNVRLATNAVGPYTPFDEPDTRLSPYALLHLSGGVTVAGAHVELGIRNLLDRHYPELRAGGFVSPGDPRAFYLTLSHLWR